MQGTAVKKVRPIKVNVLTMDRYGPVMWIGFAFWLLGVGLKVNFSRTTPMWTEVLTLIVEGAGIGFVHQPGKCLYWCSDNVASLTTVQLSSPSRLFASPKIAP